MNTKTLTTIALLASLLVTGCKGADGADGADGMNGTDGVDGADGQDGTAGAAGPAGADGADGADGTDGMDGADGMDGQDGADGSPGFQASLWWVANNGSSNAGTVTLRNQDFSALETAGTGANEGVVFDDAGHLVQAGDAAGAVSLRTVCAPSDGSMFDPASDRSIAGPATTLVNPKGIAFAPRAGVVIVADVGDAGLKVFGGAAAGDVAPIAVTTLTTSAWDLAYDEIRDRAYLALTNGTVGVIDGYAANGWTGTIDRVITPVDGAGAAIGTNLHGIAYHAASDTLVVTDVGAANAAASADFARDGSIYVIGSASTADGMVEPIRTIEGASTLLGNPVDLVLDGTDARIAEKAQGQLLVFRDVLRGASGDIAPDLAVASTAPESLVELPAPSTVLNPTDIVDPSTPVLGVFVTQNPGDTTSPSAGQITRLSRNLASSTPGFDVDVPSAENLTFGIDGTAYVSFDDGATTGGIAVIGQMPGRPAGVRDAQYDRVITGPNTGLISPKGLEIVDSLDILLVADFGMDAATSAVRVFSACASGDASPLLELDLGAARVWDLDHDLASDTLYLALTNGNVSVYENFSVRLGAGGPDRLITPTLASMPASVNLHGVRYDASSDTLILADVGSAASATDGQLFVIAFASSADGMVEVEKAVGGLQSSNLGNPVDLAYDGADLYVVEKSNSAVHLYRDFLYTPGGDVAPDVIFPITAAESVVLAPASLWY